MMVTDLFDILTKFFILILITINIGVVCQVLDNHVRYVAKDEDFTLKCQNKTDGRFAQLIWTSNTYNAQGKEMIISYDSFKNENVRINYRNRIKRINGTSIQIRQAKQGDDGTYECNIIYTYAPSKTRIRMMAVYKVIVVSAPVNIVVESGLVSVKEGESVSIYCEVQSLSPFNITWYKWDGPMTAQVSFYEDSTKVKNYYIKRKTLKVKNMTIADKGKYKCVASNLGGELFKYSYLKIKSLPVILSEDKSYVSLNKDALLKCEARGYPTIKFKWRLLLESENITLNALERYRRYHIVNAVYDSKNEIGTSVLLIKSAKKEDFHFYSCIAINSYGSSQKDIELIRVGAPDAPWITVNKLKSFPTEIYMFWNFGHNGGYLISAVTIQYRNDSFAKWTNIKLQRSLTSYALTDLIPGTMYEIRIAATNVAGQSEFSRSVKISTRSIAVRNDETSAENIGEDSDLAPIIGIFAGVFVALVAICLFAGIFVKKMKKSDNIRYTDSHNSNNFGSMPNQTSEMDGSPMLMEPLAPPADEWEFPRDRLNITTVLGQGAFGIVMRGSAQGIKGSLGQIQVAVKMVRDSKNEAATQDLLAELNLLKLIPEHPNVVGLLGCCTRHEPYYVIVEYCTYGDLQGFLRSSRGIYERYYRTSYGGAVPDLTSKMLLTFAWQIAKGMAHLAGMKVIHRDLAARNILVDDQLVCKVSDFGFARDIYVEEHYLKRSAGGRFPIKWMAIESLLDGLSTTKSDVWAYGVVLWELVTLGASPYPGMNSYEVVSFLQDGYRMDKPKHCSDDVYNVMVRCWNGSPGRRPSFGELADLCEKLVESSSTTEYISMNFYQDHLYINFDVNDNHNTPQSTLKRLGGSHGSWTSTLASLPQSESEISLQEMHCMPPLPPLRTHSSASAHAISSARIENGRGGHARPKRALRNQDNDLRRTNSESVARSTESSSLLSVRE